MLWTRIMLIGALASCSASAPPPRANASSIAAPSAPFESYESFSFGLADQPGPGYQVTARSLEVQRRLQLLVQAELQERGYVQNPAKGDFIVKLVTGTGMPPNPAAERTAGPGPARGFIGVDVYDAVSGSMVWKGTAFAEIDPATIDDALLQMGVDHMLASFPANPSQPTAKAQ